jgi:ribosomal protein L7/L12
MSISIESFVDSLSQKDLRTLAGLIYEAEKKYARIEAKYCPIHADEKALLDNGYYIDAIKAYKLRTECSLILAKAVMDLHRPVPNYESRP